MGFRQLREDVARAERRVETRLLRARTNWRVLGTVWREAWTPPRLLVAGLAGGLLIALSRPLGKLGRAGKLRSIPVARWIQLATSISGLVTALRARHAAESAQHAADDAGHAAEEAADTVDAATGAPTGSVPGAGQAADAMAPGSVSNARRRPDPPWTGEPRAAEAATEVSER